MVEIDVYQKNEQFGFIEFVETYCGESIEHCREVFPNKIYRQIGGNKTMKTLQQAWAEMLKKSFEKQEQEMESKLMVAAGSIKEGKLEWKGCNK